MKVHLELLRVKLKIYFLISKRQDKHYSGEFSAVFRRQFHWVA